MKPLTNYQRVLCTVYFIAVVVITLRLTVWDALP